MERVCYYIVESKPNPFGTGPLVAIVKENEDGYFPTDFDWGDKEAAQRIAETLNLELGLTKDEVGELVGSSMWLARQKTRYRK